MPPIVVLVSVDVDPIQIPVVPEIAAAGAFTVTTVVALVVPQAFATLYVMVAVPWAIPVTTPVVLPTVATDGVLLVHVPPIVVLVTVVVEPIHIGATPKIGAAGGTTVTISVTNVDPHVFVTIYEMTDVPVATPETIPLLLTVATPVLALLQAPPVVTSANVVEPVVQSDVVPVMALTTGTPKTVSKAGVEVAEPAELVATI